MVGKKVYLSPVNVEDYEKYTHWVNDMDVAAGLIFAKMVMGPETEKAALDRLSKDYNFAIFHNWNFDVMGFFVYMIAHKFEKDKDDMNTSCCG